MHYELLALEARNQGLRSLVGELLITNQLLREQIKQLSQSQPTKAADANESATHPQPHLNH